MYRFFGDKSAYTFFGDIAYYMLLISPFFFYKLKQEAMGLYSKRLIALASRKHPTIGKIISVILLIVESLLVTYMIDIAGSTNRAMGNLVGTGANYYGLLTFAPLVCLPVILILFINPLKQMDITTLSLPFFLIFIKLSCLFNGCCWGIPWEYGMYNYHFDHPGRQVPVQLLEILSALAIFIFLLFYRKKAKTGTLYPIYLISYSILRFITEFFRADNKKIFWQFNAYHFLAVAGVVVGILMIIFVNRYGDKIQEIFENPQGKLMKKIEQYKELKAQKLAEEKAQFELEEAERKEKVRLARQKAKARKK